MSAVAWCTLLIVLTCFLQKQGGGRRYGSICILTAMYALCILRIILPLDFTFAVVIPDSRIYPNIYRWLTAERFHIGEYPIDLVKIPLFIWAFGSSISLIRYVFSYRDIMRSATVGAVPADERVEAILRQVAAEERRKLKVSTYVLPRIESPYGLGIFRRMILLPNLDYSDEELYYILKHEYTHFLSYDILMKQVVMIFCMLFWWNPAVYLLKRDFDQAVEIKCDTFVTKKMSKAERTAYLKAILSSLHNQKSTAGMPYVSTSLSKDDEFIKARFNAVMGQKKSKRYYIMNACVIICYTLIILFSYLTILQPQIAAPDSSEPRAVEFGSDNSYILHTKDNKYWFFIDGIRQCEIDEEAAVFFENNNFVIIEE